MGKWKRIAVGAAVFGVGAGLVIKRCKDSGCRDTVREPSPVVVIPGDDPAFEVTMRNVFLLKRIGEGEKLASLRLLREQLPQAELRLLRALVDHGGYICGLSETAAILLKTDLENLGAVVELR